MRVQVPPAALDQKHKEKLAYIVGVALGDGNLSNPNGRATRLRVTCDAKYPKIGTEISKNLKFLFPNNKVSVVKRTETYFDISVYSNQLNEWIPWVVGKGSKKKQSASVPVWIYEEKIFLTLCLKGLFQTDGCIYTDRGYQMINFTNNSTRLAKDVYHILEILEFHPTFTDVVTKGLHKYTVRIARKNEVEKLMHDLGLYKA